MAYFIFWGQTNDVIVRGSPWNICRKTHEVPVCRIWVCAFRKEAFLLKRQGTIWCRSSTNVARAILFWIRMWCYDRQDWISVKYLWKILLFSIIYSLILPATPEEIKQFCTPDPNAVDMLAQRPLSVNALVNDKPSPRNQTWDVRSEHNKFYFSRRFFCQVSSATLTQDLWKSLWKIRLGWFAYWQYWGLWNLLIISMVWSILTYALKWVCSSLLRLFGKFGNFGLISISK